MTNAEAIEFIKRKIQIDVSALTEEEVQTTIEVLNMAISALEKQVGKKPKLHPKPLKNEVFWWNCPHCGAHNHREEKTFWCEKVQDFISNPEWFCADGEHKGGDE